MAAIQGWGLRSPFLPFGQDILKSFPDFLSLPNKMPFLFTSLYKLRVEDPRNTDVALGLSLFFYS